MFVLSNGVFLYIKTVLEFCLYQQQKYKEGQSSVYSIHSQTHLLLTTTPPIPTFSGTTRHLCS